MLLTHLHTQNQLKLLLKVTILIVFKKKNLCVTALSLIYLCYKLKFMHAYLLSYL